MTTTLERFESSGYATFLVLLATIGIVIALTHGFGSPFVRNYIGDIIAVMALASVIRLFRVSRGGAAGITLAIAIVIEFFQMFRLPHGVPLVLGTTFDWFDLLAYLFAIAFWIVLDLALFMPRE